VGSHHLESHHFWLQTAQRASKQSAFPSYKMAAVLIKDGRYITTGLNRFTPAGVIDIRYDDKRVHAELDAILGVDADTLVGSVLYVAGTTKTGILLKNTAPCRRCRGLLQDMKIKAIYFFKEYDQVESWRPGDVFVPLSNPKRPGDY
jgi:deoxycytidylate deaminase